MLDVRTGESVAVRYELAGLGSRFLALAIDMIVQGATAAIVLITIGLLMVPITRVAIVFHVDKSAHALLLVAVYVASFALFFGYFIIFELAWNGRTPGKRALGIRVVRDGGLPLDVGAAVVRNVVRIAEFAGAYLPSAAVALLSRENKRIGDFAAGTIVVRERADDMRDLDDRTFAGPARSDGVAPPDRDLIERFLVRRTGLEPAARSAIAARIAARVRPHLQASFEHLEDESLLEHLGRP